MTMREILGFLNLLSAVSAKYAELLRELSALKRNDPCTFAAIADKWESLDFGDVLDLVTYLEEV